MPKKLIAESYPHQTIFYPPDAPKTYMDTPKNDRQLPHAMIPSASPVPTRFVEESQEGMWAAAARLAPQLMGMAGKSAAVSFGATAGSNLGNKVTGGGSAGSSAGDALSGLSGDLLSGFSGAEGTTGY